MTHGERTLSGIAEELERRADEPHGSNREWILGRSFALREAATLIRTADDREKEAVERLAVELDALVMVHTNNSSLAIEVGNRARQALGGTNA